jgi:hypothetical protein
VARFETFEQSMLMSCWCFVVKDQLLGPGSLTSPARRLPLRSVCYSFIVIVMKEDA